MPTFVQLIVLIMHSNYSCLLHLFYISRIVEYFLYIPWGFRRSLKLGIKGITVAQSFTRIAFSTMLPCIAVKRTDEIHNHTRHTLWRSSVNIINKNRKNQEKIYFFCKLEGNKVVLKGWLSVVGLFQWFSKKSAFRLVVLLLAQK